MAQLLQVRRGTSSQGAVTVLAAGELGFDVDTKNMRVGDGTTAGGVPIYTNPVWEENYAMQNPASGFISIPSGVPRDCKLNKVLFRVQGAVSASTTINLFAGGSNTISASLTNTATSIAVATALPTSGTPYYALIDPYGASPEVVQVTTGGSTLTIVRGACGTTATAHASGVPILPLIAAQAVNAVGVTPFTPAGTVSLNADDALFYNVSGTGFAAATITCTSKWVNR